MLYSEFLKGTRAPETPDTYDQFQIIGQIYEDCEGMTKEEAYRIWKQTYGRELKRRELRQRERLELLINREDYDSADRPHRAAIYHELSTLFWAAYYNKDGSRCRLATEGRCFTDVYGITWILRYDGRYPNGNTIFKLYLKAKYQRRPTWGIDQKLQLFTYDNDGSLILPRGYADRLYNLIPETMTSVKWDKEQVEGEPVDFGPWNENFQIRDYQHPLIDSLLRKNGIGVSPAGSGKTIMGMRYIYEVGRPTLWLTHTRDLVYQTRDRALSTLKGVGRVGILGDGVEDFGDRKLIIATVQTLKAKQRLVNQKQRLRSTNVVERKPETSVLFTAVQNTPYRKPLRKWGFVRAFQSVRRS